MILARSKVALGIFVFVAMFSVNIVAQEVNPISENRCQYSLGIGGLHYQIKDKIVAPLRWQGLGGILNLSAAIIKENKQHRLDLILPIAFPKNRYDFQAYTAEVGFAYAFHCRIYKNNWGRELLFGPYLKWNMSLQFYADWNDSHLFWLNAYEFGPTARWIIHKSNHRSLIANLNFSLIAMESRPERNRYYDQEILPKKVVSKPHENMGFTILPEYLSVGVSGEYWFQSTQKLKLGLIYRLQYKTYAEPERISIMTHSLSINILWSRQKHQLKE